jgi:cyanate lyase
VSEEPPPSAGAAAAAARPGGTWGSALTCQEFAAISGVGFSAVGQVFGAAVYAAGSASGASCPGPGPSRGEVHARPAVPAPGRGDPGTFGPLVEAMYQARHAAVDRMTAECAALGGHGVVGVRLSRGSFLLGGLEFTAVGTAVRAAGAARLRAPFTSDLSGQDFARLITAGWVPAGLALGIAIRSWHDDRAVTRQARPWSGNAEMAGWTELVNQSRRDARCRLEQDVRRLGAEGVVLAGMQTRVRQRDCPVTVGRRDHIAEVTLIGTAIARFSPADHRRASPALTVMPLGPRAAGRWISLPASALPSVWEHWSRSVAGSAGIAVRAGWRNTMLSKKQAAEAVRASKARLGVTWSQLAEAVGRPVAWTTSALLGQQPMTAAQAKAACSLLELGEDVLQALVLQPTRGALETPVPADPTIYRFYEVLQVYGPTIKELIHEEFGDGIMSAINFRLDVRREPDPGGDRVVVVLDGKFLPYQW